MFGTIRKHQTWLWAIIGTITIASFLVLFNPVNRGGGSGRDRGNRNLGIINGRSITDQELSQAGKEFRLDYLLNSRRILEADNPALQFEAYKRLFLIEKLKELNISVSTTAAAKLAAALVGTAPLDAFQKEVLTPVGMDMNDFDQFVHDEAGIEQLMIVAGLSGTMITPQEAESLYRANHELTYASMVLFSASNFASSVTITPEAITNFYTNEMNLRYHLRDRVQVEYVKFDPTNYFAAAAVKMTNLEQLVDQNYTTLGSSAFPGITNETEIKAKIRHQLLLQPAVMDAQRAASQFATDLNKLTVKQTAEFEKFAASNSVTVSTSPVFDSDGPREIKLPPAFAEAAFKLSTNRPFSGWVDGGEEGTFVLALKQAIPAELEPLDRIHDRVVADFRDSQALLLAQQAAEKFYLTASNGLAQSNNFNTICERATVQREPLPPISLSTTNLPPRLEDLVTPGLLPRVLAGTPIGEISRVIDTPTGAFLIHVEKRAPGDDAALKSELPQFLAYMRRTRQNEAFNEWFMLQINRDRDFVNVITEVYKRTQSAGSPAPR